MDKRVIRAQSKMKTTARSRWNKRNAAHLRAYSRAKCLKRKLETIAAYGGKCTCCGEKEPAFLSVSHTNGGGMKHYKKVGHSGMHLWLQRNGYPKRGFGVLCMNCNMATTHGRICPHQRKQK